MTSPDNQTTGGNPAEATLVIYEIANRSDAPIRLPLGIAVTAMISVAQERIKLWEKE